MGRPATPRRPAVEGAIDRYRTGCAWRDLPREFGPWQTVWKQAKFSKDGTWDRVLTALQAQAHAAGQVDWRVSADRRSVGCTSTARPLRGARRGRRRTQGARSNDKNRAVREDEPDDHAIGRSRGGLTTKTHCLVDGFARPLVVVVSPGQAGDSPALQPMLAQLRVPNLRGGRPRTRPELLRGDKAYSARSHRRELRRRGIKTVIPEPAEAGHRKRTGSDGGRAVGYDVEDYKNRNVVERAFNTLKNWRGLATRYDKHALVFRGGVVLAAILIWLR